MRGFPLIRGFYLVKNPLVKPSLSIVEGFSTIEGSTIEGFQCTVKSTPLSLKNGLKGKNDFLGTRIRNGI